MDDGLLNKPAVDTAPVDEQKSIDKALGQLPDAPTSSTPVTTPPPQTPPADSPPASPPASTPPPILKPPIEPEKEEPEMIKPQSGFKKAVRKNGLKVVGGVAMMILIVGGVIIGRGLVQERQVVEKKAGEDECIRKETCEKDKANGGFCLLSRYTAVFNDAACEPDRDNIGTCRCDETDSTSKCDFKGWEDVAPGPQTLCCPVKPPASCEIPGEYLCATDPYVSECVPVGDYFPACRGNGTGYYWKAIDWSKNYMGLVNRYECFHYYCNENDECVKSEPDTTSGVPDECDPEDPQACGPVSSPSPSPETSPSPSPSPGPEEPFCEDLGVDSHELGETASFTCLTSFSSGTQVAYFRYSVDGGGFIADPDPVSISGGEAAWEKEIDEVGDWVVQCRVCVDDSQTSCTSWGQAN